MQAARCWPNHSPRFFVDESGLLLGVRSLAHLTADYRIILTKSLGPWSRTRRVPRARSLGIRVAMVTSADADSIAAYRMSFLDAQRNDSGLWIELAPRSELMKPGGKWVVLDYFRLHESTRNRSGHLLERFESTVQRAGYTIADRVDITEHVVPTLAFAHLLAARIALPGAQFAAVRYFAKHPVLAYLAADHVSSALQKVKLDGVDPAVFRRDKRYMLFELTRA